MHTPIEQAQEGVEALRERLRSEVEGEVRANLRRKGWRRFAFRFGGCCGVYLAMLVAVPAVALYLIARTGFVTVPVFSDRVAHERTPIRTVVPTAYRPVSDLIAMEVRDAARRGTRASDPIALTFFEGELTGAIRLTLAESSGLSPMVRQHAQVVIDRGSVEVFTRMEGVGGATTTIRIVGVPTMTNGKFAFDVRAVTIGTLGIPRVIAQRLLDGLVDRIVAASAPSSSVPPLAVDRIDLADGMLTVTVRVQR